MNAVPITAITGSELRARHRRLLRCGALAAVAAGFALSAHAARDTISESCPAPASASTFVPDAESGVCETTLQKVTVTARKVPEDAQAVPISIQVLRGEQLDSSGLSTLFDLQHHVPGLVLNSQGLFGAGFALRGVADQGGQHFNGVYLGTSHLAIARLFDIARIEVLKGPQGTLYGRNANGGSINVITRGPEPTPGGALEAAFGSFDTTRMQGHLDMPLGSVATRVAFIGSDGGGFIRNSVDDRRFGEADFRGLRTSLAVAPSERWRIDVTAQRVVDDGASNELWLPNPAYLPDPDDIHLTTVTLADPFLRIESDFASVTAEYDLDVATVRSITGYARNETNNRDDCQGLPNLLGCIRGGDPLIYRQASQELQLVSNGAQWLDWVAGAYYFAGDARDHFFQLLPMPMPRAVTDYHATADETAWAVFGHARLQLADGWGLGGGLRFTDEHTTASRIGTGINDAPGLAVAAGDWTRTSWRLDLEHTPRPGLLYYAGLSTGFRSGGITTRRLPDGTFNRYDPEDLLAFEAGLKARWPERGLSLDAAAFHYDFDNLQTTNRYFLGDEVFVEIDNAAAAEVYGMDVSGSLQASERLSLAAAVVWLPKREYLEFIRDGEDLSGYQLPRAPEWSLASSLTWRQPLPPYGAVSARVEYSYRSGFFYTVDNLAADAQDGYGLLNLLLRFEPPHARWYLFASGRNLTDTDYYHQVFIQAAPGYPDTYEVGVGFTF